MHLTFKRKSDGVLGVGFRRDFGTYAVLSVAWPDDEARKYIDEPGELERMGVELVVESEPVIETHWMDEQSIVTESEFETALTESEPITEAEATAEVEQVEPSILPEPITEPAPNTFTEAQAIREHLAQVGLDVSNRSVVEALKAKGVTIKSSQVTDAKDALRKEIAASAQSIGS